MNLRSLFEHTNKTAVVAFGRMNPPTIGHKKLAETISNLPGDGFIFLSHTQKGKTDPLDFDTKLKFAEQFFPEVTVGDPNVRTIIEALKAVESRGYNSVIYVAGEDRVDQFAKLIHEYNGKEYNFNNIHVVSAGTRNPDAHDASGMSASKLRQAATDGDLVEFSKGVPNTADGLTEALYDAVRAGLGIKEDTITELFDRPYNWQWTKNSKDKLTAQFDSKENGAVTVVISAMSKDSRSFELAFQKGDSIKRSGEGDEFGIFSTILGIVGAFLKMRPDAESMSFSAKREGLAATDRKHRDSRASLYKKMVQRYATQNNFEFAWDEIGRMTEFLVRKKENVSDADVQEDKEVTRGMLSDVYQGTSTEALIAMSKERRKYSPSSREGMKREIENRNAYREDASVPDLPAMQQQPKTQQQTNSPEAAVTPILLKKLEQYLDKLFARIGIDVEFTKHFIDRVNDQRNITPITIQELVILFRSTYSKHGKAIAQMGPDAQAVIKDMQTDINLPFVLNWDNRNQELDLVAKTVMRKKNFQTSNKELRV
jgi:hypothetical protein